MDISREDWQTAVDVPSILERFSDFHPGLLKVVAKATAAKQFPLLYREPIERWTKDYLVLAGDSAHPMLPRAFLPFPSSSSSSFFFFFCLLV